MGLILFLIFSFFTICFLGLFCFWIALQKAEEAWTLQLMQVIEPLENNPNESDLPEDFFPWHN
jgi:hypothetical protein